MIESPLLEKWFGEKMQKVILALLNTTAPPIEGCYVRTQVAVK